MMPAMVDDANTRRAILDKLARSREEMRRVLDPPRVESNNGDAPQNSGGGGFPRSRTMRTLLSSRGLGTIGALAGGLLIAKPSLALRMLRMVPVGTVGKMLLAKVITGLRAKREP
jgi:hypothetical protein